AGWSPPRRAWPPGSGWARSSSWPTAGRGPRGRPGGGVRGGGAPPRARRPAGGGPRADAPPVSRTFRGPRGRGCDGGARGDAEVQEAVRFALFHVLQAGVRGESRPIPAKGLTGPGYDGHAFWDTEAFVLPVLTFTAPDAVASALRWRQDALPAARDHAAQL